MSEMHKRLVVVLLFVVPLLHPCAATAADRDTGLITISVQNTEVAEVFEMLSRQGRVNILLADGVEGEMSINLYDVTVEKALRSIATAAGFAVERQGDTYFIVEREEAGKDFRGGLTEIRAFKVQYTDPQKVAQIMEEHLSRHGRVTALTERKLVVVEELPDFMNEIEKLLEQLDSQPKQILIEARILEVQLDDSETYGIDWARLFHSGGGDGVFGVQGLSAPGAPGFFFSLVNPNIEVALDALSDEGRVHTLSTPKLLALEHQEAQVVIGDRLGYRVTTTINQVTTESVEFIESGVILKVIPFVDRDGRIMMEIHPEVSTGTISLGIPSVSTTEVTTELLTGDGQTIMIGGLMRNSNSRRRQGIPVLKEIPLLGNLFQNYEGIKINTETIVLITPYIMKPGDSGLEFLREDERSNLHLLGERDAPDGSAEPDAPDGPVIEPSAAEQAPELVTPTPAACDTRGPSFIVGEKCPAVADSKR
jgi:type II secretory pathway component GspD/PulD (secretin)